MGFFSKLQAGNNMITPQRARQLMQENTGYVLLDVRTQSEYNMVRIDGAKLIPVDELASRAPAELPDKQQMILVYCQSGMRAGTAARVLSKLGYTNVFNFGGIMNWPYETVC